MCGEGVAHQRVLGVGLNYCDAGTIETTFMEVTFYWRKEVMILIYLYTLTKIILVNPSEYNALKKLLVKIHI